MLHQALLHNRVHAHQLHAVQGRTRSRQGASIAPTAQQVSTAALQALRRQPRAQRAQAASGQRWAQKYAHRVLPVSTALKELLRTARRTALSVPQAHTQAVLGRQAAPIARPDATSPPQASRLASSVARAPSLLLWAATPHRIVLTAQRGDSSRTTAQRTAAPAQRALTRT